MDSTRKLTVEEVKSCFKDMWMSRSHRAQRAVLAALIDWVEPDNAWSCCPTNAQLSQSTGFGLASVRRALCGLEDQVLLQREARQSRSTRFYINVGLIQQLALEERARIACAATSAQEEKVLVSPFITTLLSGPALGQVGREP